ncbi:MAG: hypothetical protein ACYC1C_04135, partial [Chloroflexota bacterium]
VTFAITDSAVIAQNNGLSFSRSDVETITWVVRERSKVPGKIGRHGIGFRSVYNLTERPRIRSGDVAFAIENALVPHLLEPPSEADRWGTRFDLPYRMATAKNGQPYPRFFADQLQHFDVRTLLFLRNVWRLSIESTTEPAFALYFVKTEEPIDVPGGAVVHLYRGAEGVPSESWLLFRDPPTGEVEDCVELAFRLDANELVPCTDGVLHIFLPTGIRTPLPFLVSGDFTPNKTRNAIIEDDTRNPWLLGRAGELLVRAVERLRDVGSSRTRVLGLLPLRKHADPPILRPLIEAAHAGLRDKEIVPTRGGGWATPRQALLLRQGDRALSDLLTADDLAFVFGQPISIAELPEGPDAHARQVLEELDVQTWGYEHLRTIMATPERLRGRPPEWFARLYAYLHTCPKALCEELRSIPLILCEDGELRSAEDKVLLPFAGKEDRDIYELFGGRYVLVHQTIACSEEPEAGSRGAVAFLRELGLEQISYTKVVEEWVLPAFTADPMPDEHLLDTYVELLRRKLEAYRRERLDQMPNPTLEAALAPVRKGLRLRTRPTRADAPPTYLEPARMVLSDAYRDPKPDADELQIAGIPEVDSRYLELSRLGALQGQDDSQKASWREFLLTVGVQATLDPVWIIDQVILPRHRSDAWQSLSRVALLQDLDFVRRHAARYHDRARSRRPPAERPSYSAYHELGRALWVRTKDPEGTKNWYDHAPNLYLPSEARIQADLEALFPPSVVPPSRFIHAQYFQTRPPADETSWPAFFESLGAANRLRVLPTERHQDDEWPYGPISTNPRRQEGGWPSPVRSIGGVTDDWAAPDLAALFARLPGMPPEARVRASSLAFKVLEAGWARGEPIGERYANKLRATLRYDQPYQRRDCGWQSWPWPSEFDWLLRKSPWLPDTEGQLHAAAEVYANTPENRRLIGSVRPLLAFEVQTESELSRHLALHRQPEIGAVLDQLAALAKADSPPDPEAVVRIYEHLARRLAPNPASPVSPWGARRRFADEALLYVPGDREPWRRGGGVFFTGPRGVFDGRRAYLKPHYPGLWPLFRTLGIPESPTVADYLRFVAEDLAEVPVEARVALAARAWVAAARLIRDQEGPTNEEAAALRALKCMMAEDGSLHPAHAIWVNDDPVAHSALRAVLPILVLPADVPLADVRPLLDLLGVPSLARSVRRRLADLNSPSEAPRIQGEVRRVVQFVQQWLFHKYPTLHEAAMDSGSYELMASLRVR